MMPAAVSCHVPSTYLERREGVICAWRRECPCDRGYVAQSGQSAFGPEKGLSGRAEGDGRGVQGIRHAEPDSRPALQVAAVFLPGSHLHDAARWAVAGPRGLRVSEIHPARHGFLSRVSVAVSGLEIMFNQLEVSLS